MPHAGTLFFTLTLTACAGGAATRVPQVAKAASKEPAAAEARKAERAAARLGPPSGRGLSLRRIDRPSSAEPPIALY